MFYWSFTSFVLFWPPSIFNPGYAYEENGISAGGDKMAWHES